jgi:hypothetical protein
LMMDRDGIKQAPMRTGPRLLHQRDRDRDRDRQCSISRWVRRVPGDHNSNHIMETAINGQNTTPPVAPVLRKEENGGTNDNNHTRKMFDKTPVSEELPTRIFRQRQFHL